MVEMVFSIAFTLFLLMDPLGNIPIYLSILKECNLKKRTQIILREKAISLVIILIFAAFGDNFLKALEISHETIFLAGGIVLFVMALKLLFPEGGSLLQSLSVDGDPLIFPLAIPLIAGPSVLAAVMIYSHQIEDWKLLYIAIFLAWFASLIILLSSTLFQKIFGDRGIKAIERLMGLILMLIAINMFLQGVTLFQTSCKMKSQKETSLLK
jgi:multiple antibiotic resistance protein